MSPGQQTRRASKREDSTVAAQVKCHESEAGAWEQSTTLLNVSPFGAALRIAQPTEPGRLLRLTLDMPRSLRCYDHDADTYQVWSLVRHVRTLPAESDELPHFEIGVAFVGKNPPTTHAADPARRYELGAANGDHSLWLANEIPLTAEGGPVETDRRREPRYPICDDVVIEIYDANGEVYARESANTENISRHGLAVITNLNVVRGRYIRVRSARYNIAVIAAVRRLAQLGDGHKRLHLEFVDQQWPPL